MPFVYDNFKTLTGGWYLRASPFDTLRALVQVKPAQMGDRAVHAAKVKRALELLPVVKIKEFEAGVKYLIEEYTPLIPELPPAPVHPTKASKRVTFAGEWTEEKLDRGDLIYGIADPRAGPKYASVLFKGGRYADVYNNYFGIGTGEAFGKRGRGFADDLPTPESVLTSIGRVELTRNVETMSEFEADRAVQRRAYIDGLMRSRFSPTLVFGASTEDLSSNNNTGMGVATQSGMNTALWNKAIRNACKYGIEMIGTDPVFTSRGAQVHFVLDQLADIGKMALKKSLDDIIGRPARSDYIPITSSEITYVFRNWTRLSNTVRFWVNGLEVQAPWLSQWTEDDPRGNAVNSNWEAWQRYKIKRWILKGQR